VDGGAYSLTNGDLLEGLDLDLVIASAPMAAAPRGLRATVDGVLRGASAARLRSEMIRVRLATRVLVLEPSARDLAVMGTLADAMDRARVAAVVRQVRSSTSERLRRVKGADVLRYAGRIRVGTA
jgi:hypothetical protein